MLLEHAQRFYEITSARRETPWVGYMFALGAIAFAYVIRLLLSGYLEGFPFLTFFPAVIVTAFIFGIGAGLLAALGGGLIEWSLLLPSGSLFATPSLSNLLGLFFYLITVTVILFLTATTHSALRAFNESDLERRRLNSVLESRVVARTRELEITNHHLIDEARSRAAAEAQVRQMQKMEAVGQLTGGIAHDFNNMLAIIIGSLDMAKRYVDRDRQKVAVSIANAFDGAQRAAQLTARLLAFSRQQPLDPRPLDANKLISSMSELLRRTIGEQMRLETVLSGGTWPLFADASQLENAIINLCVNSRDAMPNGGRLTLETMNASLDDAYVESNLEAIPGQYVVIAVSDTGMGMSKEIISRAFDPFFTTKPAGKGSGLGLSQVYGFAKQSRGHVKIYSEPGEGTTVRIYLPRHSGEVPVPAATPQEIPHHDNMSSAVILVVEDDPRVRLAAINALQELGYTTLEAADAHDAIKIANSDAPIDLLFTDIIMPDINGRVLAEHIKTLRPSLEVLYTTGYTRNAVIHNGMLDRDVSFLQKPFTIEQLAAKVRQVLNVKQSQNII